jgi:ankyrin repeat protein
MDTYQKLASTPTNKKLCNCVAPFFLSDINGINPNTGRPYTDDDRATIKSTLIRMSNAKGCTLTTCCEASANYTNIDPTILREFSTKFSHYQLIHKNGLLDSINLWNPNATASTSTPTPTTPLSSDGWLPMEPYIICKISKATLVHIKPNIINARNLVNDCYSNNCDNIEVLQLNNILSHTATTDLNNTFVDDYKLYNAIKDHDMVYLQEYIRTYGMIDHPLSYNKDNNRIIHVVAQYGTPEMLNLVLALKPNIDIINTNGNTAMHLAAFSNTTQYATQHIEKLIESGASINIVNMYGETPIHYAIRRSDLALVRLLYQNGASLLYNDKHSNNLLHYTILHSNFNALTQERSTTIVQIIQFLLEHGVSSIDKNSKELTPLELIAHKLHRERNNNTASAASTGTTHKKQLTLSESTLLQLQTLIFNNIIQNNPDKYMNKYVNVTMLPRGAPIKALQYQCVDATEPLTGDEDSTACTEKGGKLVKITDVTTKIKLNFPQPTSDNPMEALHPDMDAADIHNSTIEAFSNAKLTAASHISHQARYNIIIAAGTILAILIFIFILVSVT